MPNSYLVASRDYLRVKLWDLRKSSLNSENNRPIYSAVVADYMDSSLTELYQNQNVQDKFFLDVTPDGKHLATGCYNRSGHVIDLNATTNTSIYCKFKSERDAIAGKLMVYGRNKRLNSVTESIEIKKRVMLGCWAPFSKTYGGQSQTLALVFRNCVYIYYN